MQNRAEKSALSKELFDARSSPLKARYSEKVFVFGFFSREPFEREWPQSHTDMKLKKSHKKKHLKNCIKSKAYLLVIYILRDSRAYTQRDIFNHVSHLRAIYIIRSRRALAER